jgi:hypothetical protein
LAAGKKGRPAKDEGEVFVPITILVPAATKSDLEWQAQADGRPLSEIARRRLGQVETDRHNKDDVTPKAAALGRIVALLANELMAYSPPGREADYLRQGIGRIVAKLNPTSKGLPDPAGEAELLADLWALRLHNSGERTYASGKTMPLSAQQRVLAEIWKQLAPSTRDSKESA